MRELIERFSYRFKLWQHERYGDRWGADPTAPRNPLRIMAVLCVFFLILDATQPFFLHRAPDPLIFVRIPAALLFLVLYSSRSRWAWQVLVVWFLFSFVVYWTLRIAGYPRFQPRGGAVHFQIEFALFDGALTAAIVIWLFWTRERYFRYIEDCRAEKT
jgi:hypothetical protein